MSETMTITEALAEIPLAKKKIDNAQDNILRYLARPEDRKDPHEEDGGSGKYIMEQIQSINDVLERMVRIRRAIARANASNTVQVSSHTKTIEEWLIWRRETYPKQRRLYNKMIQRIDLERRGDRRDLDGVSGLVGLNRFEGRGERYRQTEYPGSKDVTVEYDEKHLGEQLDELEEINGALDGRLTLFNSTVEVEF